jgi:hypothetical protein
MREGREGVLYGKSYSHKKDKRKENDGKEDSQSHRSEEKKVK